MKISKKASIYDLVKSHPEIKDVMVQLGFSDIIKPGMLQTAGKIMNLEKGSKIKSIPMDKIIEVFKNHGFILE